MITAFAGYLVILRGRTFTVGDRITMGGVRGDVIALGFLQTRILEMGESTDAASEAARRAMEARYFIEFGSVRPRIYYALTDNWLEMNLRFLTPVHGVRSVKDELQRMILDRLDAAGIGIASTTFEVVGLPPVHVNVEERERQAR